MSIKKIFGKLHLWFGLATGLVVFIVAITGAIYCFAPELQNATQTYRFVKPLDKPFILPSQIKATAEKQLPGKSVKRLYLGEEDKAAYALFSDKNGNHFVVFINPYSGDVLKVKNMRKDFFTIVLNLHRTLLIPYGKEVVGWCTLIFLTMLISGIVLWWPRNKAARKQRFKLKFSTSPRRLNYDLHNVLGFYASWIALFIAITGLIWSFGWFANGVYTITGASHSIVKKKAPSSDTTNMHARTMIAPIDLVWEKLQPDMQEKYVAAEFILPQDEKGSILLRGKPENGTFYKMDFRYFDQYTSKEIPGAYVWGQYKDAQTIADNIKRMNYDIHTGAILGWPGRVAVFFAALIVASLPITGFYIWWGRRKKSKKTLYAKETLMIKTAV